MKYFVAVLLLAAVVFADAEWKIQTAENLNAYRPECANSLSIPEDKVNEYKKWNFPNDEKTQCYIKCIFGKMGLFNEKDGFNVEHLVKQLGQGKNETIIRPEVVKCADKNPQKTNACQWAYRGFDCFKKAHLDLVQTSVKKN
ncbi:general odorant-binding protein 99a-like [Sitodiplosis mosellana]|uniref:general odorant-binding protein 99a-like n=1 Tax=Sitodiplosis mosellana TaxID=263140 RepID=UPI002445273D|nr:general odorant-binding protein 99a-like [Sitodiplosis mosellana]